MNCFYFTVNLFLILFLSLRDALIGYIDACPYEEDLIIDNTLMASIGQIPSDKEDPQHILTGQSVDVWCLINRILTRKQRQRHQINETILCLWLTFSVNDNTNDTDKDDNTL